MKFNKTSKVAFAIVAVTLLCGATKPALFYGNTEEIRDSASAATILQNTAKTYAAFSSYRDRGTTIIEFAGNPHTMTFKILLARPTSYRVDWKSSKKHKKFNGVVWSTGNGDFLQKGTVSKRIKRINGRDMALAAATGISGGVAATIPGIFFNSHWGNPLGSPNVYTRFTRQKDEGIRGVDCFVLFNHAKVKNQISFSITLWIGKKDHLVHQIRKTTIMLGMPKINGLDAAKRALLQNMIKQMKGQAVITTEIHEDIQVNKNFSKSDFIPN